MSDVKFTISAIMEEKWVIPFLSMLDKMEENGNIGHSEMVGMYSDGEGDFRPHFKAHYEINGREYAYLPPSICHITTKEVNKFTIYDADKETFKKHFKKED